MPRSTTGLAVAFASGALVAGALALWLSGGESTKEAGAPLPPPPVAEPTPPPEDDPFSIPPDQLAAVMEKLKELEGRDAGAPEPQGDEPPPPPPTQVHYSVPEKYEREALSEVPHQLLGAWDEAPEAGAPGRHRSFVLVVDPNLTDRQLESLSRDVHRLHRDADRLDVRIYDRENAATDSRVSDGGRYAYQHQVAQVTRHRELNVDVIRVRGRVVGP